MTTPIVKYVFFVDDSYEWRNKEELKTLKNSLDQMEPHNPTSGISIDFKTQESIVSYDVVKGDTLILILDGQEIDIEMNSTLYHIGIVLGWGFVYSNDVIAYENTLSTTGKSQLYNINAFYLKRPMVPDLFVGLHFCCDTPDITKNQLMYLDILIEHFGGNLSIPSDKLDTVNVLLKSNDWSKEPEKSTLFTSTISESILSSIISRKVHLRELKNLRIKGKYGSERTSMRNMNDLFKLICNLDKEL